MRRNAEYEKRVCDVLVELADRREDGLSLSAALEHARARAADLRRELEDPETPGNRNEMVQFLERFLAEMKQL